MSSARVHGGRSGMVLAVLVGGLLLTFAGLVTPGQSQDKPAKAPPQATSILFDGQSLDGWTVEGDCQVAVEEGLLVLKEGNGWLRSDLMYRDFTLHVEWKGVKTADYDSGVYVRTLAGGAPFPSNSYQVNLLDGSEGNVKNLKPTIGTKGPIKRGEWNSFDITCVGSRLKLAINGKPVYDVDGLKNREGYIGLQCEVMKGGEFQFRNLKITEVGYSSLFNGQDLAGWEGGGAPAESCWLVEEGLLVCNGKKGPWLKTLAEYGDFDFRFEYQVSPGGNSGVYVRVPADGNHHRENDTLPPAGFEVQVLDDSAPQYAQLKDYQYCGSVYDICGAQPRVCRAVGHWNTMSIRCEGQHVTVTHNGKVVADITETSHPLIALRKTRGFLGLQNHDTQVRFRNLRLAELDGGR